MPDPNNRPGGPNLVLTAKSDNKIQFFDAATLTLTGEIDMPASTHEMVLSPDGKQAFASVYGGGIFGKNKNPDRRIAVIDLATKSLARTIDLGDALAPHSLMMDRDGMLWCTAELGEALLVVDPATGTVERIAAGGRPHWIAISHAADKVFASFKAAEYALVVDRAARKPAARIRIPNLCEGLAASPDGETIYLCAHLLPEFHVIDARTHSIRRTVKIEGCAGEEKQLKRVRVSPNGAFILVSSLLDNHVAIFDAASLQQTGSIETPKGPMGFGFTAGGQHAYVCCHDDAIVLVLDMAAGLVTDMFRTAAGCEFIIAYE